MRVNTLLLPTEEAIQKFQDEEWILSKFLDKNDYEGFLKKISILEEGEFIVDIHIPDLLIFPPRTEFHNHPAYQKGSILLQDKVRFDIYFTLFLSLSRYNVISRSILSLTSFLIMVCL